jgi:hypothetical protein
MAKTGLPLKKITSKSILFLTNVTRPAYHCIVDREAVNIFGVNSQAMSASSELEPGPSRSGAGSVERLVPGPAQGVGWGGFTPG